MTVQDAFSEVLSALGFDTLARDVVHETDPARLARYARIIAREAPPEMRERMQSALDRLGYWTGGRR